MPDMKNNFGHQTPAFITMEPKGLLIDGKWRPASSGEAADSINPATGALLGKISMADAHDVDLAVAAARRALEGPWGRFTPADRQRVLLKLADLIEQEFDTIQLMDTMDMGMPISSTPMMRRLVVDTFRFAAGQAVSIHGETLSNSMPGNVFTYTLKEPVGVVGGIIPWNGPAFNATWKVAPTLATGCTLVLKCAEPACYSALRLGELCLEAGVPPGVINIITGRGDVAGQALAAHRGVDKIAFTGSTATGRKILEASGSNFKRLTLELGGKSPDIVLADADLEQAVPGVGMGVFANTGQGCLAGSRVFVERSIHDAFLDKLAEFSQALRVGNPLDPETQIGPLVSAGQLKRVVGYLDAGKNEGAQVVTGGARLTGDGYDDGYFVPPTVFTKINDQMKIAREEIFGPVVVVTPFDTVDEAIQAANNTEYGLASGVWTNDLSRAQTVSRGIKCTGPG